MSLRLGGPARGFVLITSRRESERGEVHGGEEELSLSSLFSNFLSLFPHIPFSVSLPPPLCLFLSFSLFSLFYHSDRREGRRPRTSLKSKSRRKGGRRIEERRIARRITRSSLTDPRRTACELHYSQTDVARDCEFASSSFNGTHFLRARLCFKI